MSRFHLFRICGLLLVLVCLAVPAHASLYDFEALALGNLIGQDNWIHANTLAATGNEQVVGTGVGTNTSKVAVPNVGNDQVYRANDANFSIPTFTGAEQIYLQADFQVGTQLAVFGLLRSPGGASYSATSPWLGLANSGTPAAISFNFRPSFVPGGAAQTFVPVGAAAATDDWVRMKMDLNLAANGGDGSANISYMNLTQGQVAFTPIVGMQNLTGGMLVNTGNKYLWDSMFMRGGISGGNNAMDNLEVGAVPEPSAIALGAIGLLGLLGYGWRKRRSAK